MSELSIYLNVCLEATLAVASIWIQIIQFPSSRMAEYQGICPGE